MKIEKEKLALLKRAYFDAENSAAGSRDPLRQVYDRNISVKAGRNIFKPAGHFFKSTKFKGEPL